MGQPTRLEEGFLRALDLVAGALGRGRFYLAGGTALTYHLGHRTSRDLDLMSFSAQEDLAEVQRRLKSAIPDLTTKGRSDATLRVDVAGVPVDFVRYPYPLTEPALPGPGGIPVAALGDLAAMKLSAISSRGIQRDFWDLHAIVTGPMELRDAIASYDRRYGAGPSDRYHLLRSLTYFADAERADKLPEGLTAGAWEEIKAWFRAEVPPLIRPADDGSE